jgi:hypothetical protein
MTHEKVDMIKVILANMGAYILTWIDAKDFATFMAEHIQTALSCISLTLAILYTSWKWRNDIKKKKANLKKHYDEKG